jgi:hypothetical protein
MTYGLRRGVEAPPCPAAGRYHITPIAATRIRHHNYEIEYLASRRLVVVNVSGIVIVGSFQVTITGRFWVTEFQRDMTIWVVPFINESTIE